MNRTLTLIRARFHQFMTWPGPVTEKQVRPALLLLLSITASALDVLTVHYNQERTGTNVAETVLNQGNVNVSTFGKLYTRALDGGTYAQPLYVSGVVIAGTPRNVLYVATQHNTVYAFDADDSNGASAPLWTTSLGQSVPYRDAYINGDTNVTPEIGITSTPVIDKQSGTLYAVAFTKDPGPTYHYRLHALDLSNGSEKFSGPTDITYQQTIGGHVLTFNPRRQNQRPGLALANGSIYIAFASFGDLGLGEPPETAYNGYVMRYSATTMQQQAVLVAAPGGSGAGIWQVGCGPAIDAAGNVYVVTGNGTSDTTGALLSQVTNYGQSALRLTANLVISDFFTPYNRDTLNNSDNDLGAAGHVLVDVPTAPVHKHLLIHGSKEGKIYVLDRDNMGHFHAGDNSQVVQIVTLPNSDQILCTPVYWQGPAGRRIFADGQAFGGLHALGMDAVGTLTTAPVASARLFDGATFRGSHMTVSSNGTAAGSGVVWTFSPTSGDPLHIIAPGILRAFNAETLQEIYNSQQNALRDAIGNYPKYVPPTVVNGRIFVPTFSNQLHVFGLVPANPNLTVVLTQPPNSSSYSEPAAVPLAADAVISSGSASIVKVEFYAGSVLVAQANTVPFSGTWTNAVAGSYALRAIATDSNGASATSSAVLITINGNSSGTGTILRQVWNNIGPSNFLTALTSIVSFPNNPTTQEMITSFEGRVNSGDFYGSRIVGYVNAPLTGAYTFWIASDNQGELWLSSDDNPLNKIKIAFVNDYTASRDWTKYPSQQSLPIMLNAGQSYYIEALHKEGMVGDNLAVGWLLPSGVLERPIPGIRLSSAALAGVPPYGVPSRGTLATLPLPPDLNSSPPATLSATGVFNNLASLTPSSGIIPYTPNAVLWSDAAFKNRWIAIPNNARIGFAATGEWTFPGGTIFIKEFELAVDDTNPSVRKRLETRLLVLDNSGANGYGITYKWRNDNSDADLVPSGGADEDVIIATSGGGTRVQTWHYPSQNDCLRCHTTNSGFVLGVKTRQLNGTITYPNTGIADNQLRTWNSLRLFTTDIGEGNIAGFSRSKALNDTNATLEDRVKSYLDVNCSNCHRPGGIVSWDGRYDVPMVSQGIINGSPIHGDLGVVGAQIVSAGDMSHSLIRLRMGSTTDSIKMPPLARNFVDTAALSVIDAWIASLPNSSSPTVATPATAGVNMQSATLSVLGADDGGEAALKYTWSVLGAPPATVVFSVNGTNAAKLSSAIFTAVGTYDLRVMITDSGGLSATSDVSVTVTPLVTSMAVIPSTVSVATQAAQIFTASARDQFGAIFSNQPPITWTVNGGGVISTSGVFTAAAMPGGPFVVTADVAGITAMAAVTVTSAAAVGSGLTAAYWSNQDKTFSGTPTLLRIDPLLNFDWAAGSPDPSLTIDHFTVRWTGQVQAAQSETYTFITTTDDGVRLWINGQLLIDKWINQSATDWSGTIALLAGQRYDLKMEYYESAGGAQSRLSWMSPSTPRQIIPQSRLFPTAPVFSQPPTVIAAALASPTLVVGLTTSLSVLGADDGGESALAYSWSPIGTPPAAVAFSSNGNNAAKISTATFAAAGSYVLRATITDTSGASVTSDVPVTVGAALTSMAVSPVVASVVPAGTQQFFATARDQFGFAMPSQPGLAWAVNGGGTISTSGLFTAEAMAGGPFMVNATGAGISGSASVTVTPVVVIGTGLTAEYWSNQDRTFTGAPTLARIDPKVDFDWGDGSPDASVTINRFTVRWTGQVQAVQSETYTFTTNADDGTRLWVNGQLLIDKWINQSATLWSGPITLAAGQRYDLKLEYFENGGSALAHLLWSSASTPRQVIPQTRLFPVPAAPVAVALPNGSG